MVRDKKGYFAEMTPKRVISAVFSLLIIASAQPFVVWIQEYNYGADDFASAVAADGGGNIVVVGSSYNGTDFDWLTIKYNPSGETLWTRRYDLGASEVACDVAIDTSGNIVIVGSVFCDTVYRCLIVKYDSIGNVIWSEIYGAAFDNFGIAVDIDSHQDVLVAGYCFNGLDYDFLTLKYSPTGVLVWNRKYDAGSNDVVADLAVDSDNGIVVTGSSYTWETGEWVIHTVKYSPMGDSIWVMQYNHPIFYYTYANSLDSDSECNVVVTGRSFQGIFFIIKYSPAGDTIWRKQYQWYDQYTPRKVAIDMNDNIFVTGEHLKQTGFSYNFRTGKFSPDGDTLWSVDYQYGYDDPDEFARGIAIDPAGRIAVTGYTDNGTDYDYLTLVYEEQGFVHERLSDRCSSALSVSDPYPNPFSNNCGISFDLVKLLYVSVTVCDATGRRLRRLIERECPTGLTRVVWDGADDFGRSLPSGVYFVRLETSGLSIIKKIVKLR